MICKLYHASSLDQIAVMFMDQCEREEKASMNGKTKKEKDMAMARAITWRHAALLLNQTELHK